jgi:hypothetical protein
MSGQRAAWPVALCRDETHESLGWFTDNELRWGPDWRGSDELLTLFLSLPPEGPGRLGAIDFLKQRYASVTDFNAIWGGGYASWEALASATEPLKPPYVLPPFWEQNQEIERAGRANAERRPVG